MAEIQEVMLLILTHYGHSYLMHKISNNVLSTTDYLQTILL